MLNNLYYTISSKTVALGIFSPVPSISSRPVSSAFSASRSSKSTLRSLGTIPSTRYTKLSQEIW